MTAPLFYVPDLSGLQAGAPLEVVGEEAHHAAGPLRLRAGEPVLLADGSGDWCRAVVTGVARDVLTCEVAAVHHEPVPRPWLRVVQAVPKGERAERAVETLTEVGVDEIVPWISQRTVVRWDRERADRALARWRRVARAASKQARRIRPPVVAEPLRGLPGGEGLVVLHESAPERLSDLRPADVESVTLVVGPEGGLADEELAGFRSGGAQVVRLGREVLRTSTAGTVASGLLNTMTGRW